MVQDPHGRPLRNLRISVNRACNLDCGYCHLEGGAMAGGDITPDEFARLGRIAAELGCTSAKITGGEPTLRRDLPDIISHLSDVFQEVSMTTNGLLLDRQAHSLKDAGLDRINVSLDSTDPDTYRALTRGGDVHQAIRGIDTAITAGLTPIKVNMVVIRDVNVDHIPAMEAFTRERGIGLQLIELHTDRENACGVPFKRSYVSLRGIETDLSARAAHVETAPQHARKRYHLPHLVEVVRPYGNEDFCASCHRLRLTGDGKLKPCLMRQDNHVDIIELLRNGADDDALRARFLQANAARAPYWPAPQRDDARTLPTLPVIS